MKKETINIMAIDPSSNKVGVAIYNIDVLTLDILKIESRTIDLTIKENNNEFLNNLLFRFVNFEKYVLAMIKHYNPRMLAIESGFINKLRPAAYGPLSQSIMIVEKSAIKNNPLLMIHKYPPSIIKKHVGASFKADKLEVLEKVCLIKEITKHVNPKAVTEHEVDAIAINKVQLDYLRNNKVLLCLI